MALYPPYLTHHTPLASSFGPPLCARRFSSVTFTCSPPNPPCGHGCVFVNYPWPSPPPPSLCLQVRRRDLFMAEMSSLLSRAIRHVVAPPTAAWHHPGSRHDAATPFAKQVRGQADAPQVRGAGSRLCSVPPPEAPPSSAYQLPPGMPPLLRPLWHPSSDLPGRPASASLPRAAPATSQVYFTIYSLVSSTTP